MPTTDHADPFPGVEQMTDLRGTYWQHKPSGRIVQIRGMASGPDATHWGICRSDPAQGYLDVRDPDWHQIATGEPCPTCGARPPVPMAIHKCDPHMRLVHAARLVLAGGDLSLLREAVDRL